MWSPEEIHRNLVEFGVTHVTDKKTQYIAAKIGKALLHFVLLELVTAENDQLLGFVLTEQFLSELITKGTRASSY